MKRTITSLFLAVASLGVASAQVPESASLRANEGKEMFLSGIYSSDQLKDFSYRFVYDKENRFVARDLFKYEDLRMHTDSLYYDDHGNIVRLDIYKVLVEKPTEDPATWYQEPTVVDTRFVYTYNEKNQMTHRTVYMLDLTKPFNVMDFFYREDGLLDRWEETTTANQMIRYEYNDKKLLIKETLYGLSGSGADRVETARASIDYTYDANDNLLKAEYRSVMDNWATVFKEDIYKYEDDNLISFVGGNQGGRRVFDRVFEYDKSIDGTKVFYPQLPFTEISRVVLRGLKNCRTKETYYSLSGGSAEKELDYTYTYSFPASTKEVSREVKVKVYPNPATDLIGIEASDIQKIKLFTLNGEQVRSLAVDADVVRMGVSSLPRGVYLLQVQTGVATTVQKVVLR